MKSRHAPWVAAALAAGCLLTYVSPGIAQRSQQTREAIQVPADIPRFSVVASPSTLQAGTPSHVKVELQDGRGRKVNAAATVSVLVTVTTLPTAYQAKQASPSGLPAAPPSSLDGGSLTLGADRSVLQLKALFPKGQGDVDFQVTSNRLGDVRIFVEAVGTAIQPGTALITVARDLRPLRRREPSDVQRISWQPDQDAVYLRFKDSGQDVIRRGREFVRPFFVALELIENGQPRPMLPPGGTDLTVELSILKGRGRFDRQSLVIPSNSINSSDSAELLSSVGGTIEMAARSLRADIRSAHGIFTFEPGARATRLKIRPLTESAIANGLDSIKVEVEAIYEENGRERIMKADDEGLPERPVSFKFIGGSAHLKGGLARTAIASKDTSAIVEVVASRPVRALTIEAHAENALGEPITGEAEVAFNLPLWQLFGAVIGGLLVPAIRRATKTLILLGAVAGMIMYVAALFGALATGEYNVGGIAILLTRLPTENFLAALLLGIIGGFAISLAPRMKS